MRTLLLLLGLGIFAVSCEKIIAEDITAETPVLVLPSVNDTVNQNPVHFKWEEIEGASKYRLEVVSPCFSAISQFPLDTIVTGTDFFFGLDSSQYEMRLTALNGGYESQTTAPVIFWVGVQQVGGGNNVVLNAPVDQSYVNATFNNQFSWTPVAGATSYEFSLREGTSFSTGSILETQNGISTSTYIVPSGLLPEGEYSWGVKAYFGSVETPFATNQLFVDETDPNVAALVAPADLSVDFAGTITFSWANGTDSGTVQSPVTSILEIATDVNFTNIVESEDVDGSTTDVDLLAGSYFWRVRNEDEAGNTAGASSIYELTLN